jgi:S1-C subfamily serine protease
LIEEPTSQERRRLPGWLSAILFFGAVAVVVLGIAWAYPGPSTEAAPDETTTTSTSAAQDVDVSLPGRVAGDEPVADSAEVILPSVVYIQTQSGVGSGVVYDQGLIMTAAHVVEGSDTVRVRFTDGTQVAGTVLGTAGPDVDIAVIEVDRDDLTPATFVTDKPRVGQMAVAVGSPWGLESTVTAGIVSAIDQTNCSFIPGASQASCAAMVQTDAAINPGNSGGPLVDRNGHVLGINVSIFTDSGANDGVGFAVPAHIATTYADAIVSGEPIVTAHLGVQTAGDVPTEGQAGAVIGEVFEDTGAEEAGIQEGDVVIALDGVPVLGGNDLQAQVRAHQPGETVDILIIREGEEITLTATLGVRSEDLG